MELSIIITSYKSHELLKLCLDSVKKNTQNIESEIIVAESESGEDSEIMMREDFPDAKFFPFKENVGFQALLKKGIEESSGKYIFILNGDMIATEGSIKKLLDYLKNNPDVGMVGPKLLNFNGTLQYSCFHFYRPLTVVYRRTFLKIFRFAKKHLNWFLMKDFDHQSAKDVDWLMGSAIMISRQAMDEVGLMDSQFFMYMEDVDWCRRFWEKKYKVIYYQQSLMHHYHGQHSRGGKISGIPNLFFNKYTWIHIMSAVKYFKKYRGKPLPH
jgi:GT2 family glycosyltransferase